MPPCLHDNKHLPTCPGAPGGAVPLAGGTSEQKSLQHQPEMPGTPPVPTPPDPGRSAAGLAEGQLTQVWLFVVIDATEQAVFTQFLAGWMGSPNPCVIVSSNPRDVSGRRVSDEQIASHQSGINTCAITEAPADSAGEDTRRRGGSTKATTKMCQN